MDISSIGGTALTEQAQMNYQVACMKMAQHSENVANYLILDKLSTGFCPFLRDYPQKSQVFHFFFFEMIKVIHNFHFVCVEKSFLSTFYLFCTRFYHIHALCIKCYDKKIPFSTRKYCLLIHNPLRLVDNFFILFSQKHPFVPFFMVLFSIFLDFCLFYGKNALIVH